MILTLKLPGLAFEINLAATTSNDDVQGANSNALKKIGFMDVIHYSFSYMGVLTGNLSKNLEGRYILNILYFFYIFDIYLMFIGPYYRYRTYWDCLHRPFANYVDPWPLTYYKLKQITVFVVLFIAVNHLFPSDVIFIILYNIYIKYAEAHNFKII